MTLEAEVKRQVREFYDGVGWREVGEGVYQNARFEDLRPVSREYIHRCHLRVLQHLPESGRRLLDAGSGPIQYPEYIEYSRAFQQRVCLDVSRRALQEARSRIGDHGRFVVGDVAHLPFRAGSFEAAVCLHTVHHLPSEQHRLAFEEIERSLMPYGRAVVVQSWGDRSGWMRLARWPIRLAFGLIRVYRALGRRNVPRTDVAGDQPQLTFTRAPDYGWVRTALAGLEGLDVRVWRSVSTSFLRAFIHRRLGGGAVLRAIYALEEAAPRFLGRHGQYAMIVFRKSNTGHAPAEGSVQ